MKRILFLLLLLPNLSKGQTINTFAGNGTPASGDTGPATAATFNQPHSLGYDAAGNLYIADSYNDCIRKISVSGVITTVAGNGAPGYSGDNGPATAAQLNQPFTAQVNAAGYLFIGDNFNHSVRMVSPSGTITTIAGNGSAGFYGDGGPATAAQFYYATGIAIDASGNIYIGDQFNNRIRKIDAATGIITTFAGTGAPGYAGDGGAATNAQLYYPNYLHFDGAGNLYISDNQNDCIRKVTPAGIISTVAGNGSPGHSGDGGSAIAAQLNYPGGTATDAAGNLYIADDVNHVIRKVNTAGIISTIVGTGTAGYSGDGGPALSAELNTATDVIFDNAGDMLIADFNNYRVRIVISCANDITGQPLNDTVLEGSTATYTVTTSMASPVYQWQEDPGTGFVDLANVWPYSGVTTNTLTIHNASTYLNATHYRCIITNSSFCIDSSASAILIVHSSTGIEDVIGESIKIYPNPAHDDINVSLPANITEGTITLTNQLGQVLAEEDIKGNLNNVSIARLPTGIYFLKIQFEGHVVFKKVIKN